MNRKPRFFIDKLTPAGVKDERFALYDFESERLRWSAPFPLPAIGTRIYITMNSIGWATVEGFFAEDGYLGVMTKAENPPQWLREQRQRAATRNTPETPEWLKRGIGCEFGRGDRTETTHGRTATNKDSMTARLVPPFKWRRRS